MESLRREKLNTKLGIISKALATLTVLGVLVLISACSNSKDTNTITSESSTEATTIFPAELESANSDTTSVTQEHPVTTEHEHIYEDSTVSATCTTGGYTAQTCKECGYVATTNETPALGHSWSAWTVTKEATTTAAGSKTRTCRSCGKSATEATPKLSAATHTHSYTSKVVEATCTAGGYTRHTCSCGKTYDSDQTEPRSHLYGDWETTVQPTTSQEGEKKCSCTRCGHTLTEAVPKLPTQTAENQSGYVDSRVSIRRRGDGATNYGYGSVNVTDTRSWGGRPSVSVTSAGGLSVSYYKQDGSKVYCTVEPKEDYVKWMIILDDGSYTISLIGDFDD